MPTNIQSEWFGGPKADLGDPIEQSLRFRKGSQQTLVGTSAIPVDDTYTLSFWYKHTHNTSAYRGILFSEGGASNKYISFNAVNGTYSGLEIFNGSNYVLYPPQSIGSFRELRDPSAWYHCVFAQVNGTSFTIYINGEQAFQSASYFDWTSFALGSTNTTHYSCDGYIADLHHVDGTALTPTSFGKYNDAGVWVPQTYSGTYGTNGFHLTFDSSQANGIGHDSSGNNKHFTASSFDTAAISSSNFDNDIDYEDTPTNNTATLNPLVRTFNTIQNANLEWDQASPNDQYFSVASMRMDQPTYGEMTALENTNSSYPSWGICNEFKAVNVYQGYDMGGAGIATDTNSVHCLRNGGKYAKATYSSPGNLGGPTWAAGDIVRWTFNPNNGECRVAVNGGSFFTWHTLTTSEVENEGYKYFCAAACNTSGAVNFGNRPFVYSIPTGYTALATNNLPEPTIKNGKDHFDVVTYSGTGVAKSETGLEFQPDFVWIKERGSLSESHILMDSVRGTTSTLRSNTPGNEVISSNYITSFDSNGFSVGTDSGTNNSSGTYVAWCWKAGDTASVTYTVKVVSDSGNKYRFDDFGTSAVTLDLEEGGTYVFDQSDASNSNHPLRFSTTSDGTHGGGSEYTTGVTTTGTPGSAGAKTTITVASGAPTLYYYCSVHSGMGGQANTNDTKGSSNFDGTIQSKMTANTDAGFSIVSYTGVAPSTGTVGHGLNSAPEVVLVKDLSSNVFHWQMKHTGLSSADHSLLLNEANAEADYNSWQNTAPTNSVVSLGAVDGVNTGSNDYIMYCWHSVEGYSKFGSFTGNSSTDGPFIYTGMKISFLILKNTSVSEHWLVYDTTRSPNNPVDETLYPSLNFGEMTGAGYEYVDILSNGFKMITNSINQSGHNYVYMAFAENPFGGENAAPATAR